VYLSPPDAPAPGTVVAGSETRYRPYGEVRTAGRPVAGLTARTYTGQAVDEATGLMFYNARWYDPALGRFISADPVVSEPGNPQSLNRFAYVLGNPLRYVDPTGHFSPEQLAEWFGENWRDLFSAEWQTLLLEAELGDAAVYGLTSAGDPRFFVFAIDQGEDLIGWNTDPYLYYLGPSPIQKLISQLHLRKVADAEVALFRSKFANPAGGASDWPEWDAFLSSIVRGTSSVSTIYRYVAGCASYGNEVILPHNWFVGGPGYTGGQNNLGYTIEIRHHIAGMRIGGLGDLGAIGSFFRAVLPIVAGGKAMGLKGALGGLVVSIVDMLTFDTTFRVVLWTPAPAVTPTPTPPP